MERGLAPHVTVHERSAAVPNLDAAFDVDLMDGPTLRNIDATVAHAGASARVRANRVRFAGGDVAVDAVVVDGLGETTTGSFDRKGTVLRFAAHAPRLDLERLAKLAALEETLRGTLVLDADVSVDRYRATGQARARLAGGRIGTVEGITASFDGHLLGRKFVGAARAQAADLGTLEIDAKEPSIGGTGALARGLAEGVRRRHLEGADRPRGAPPPRSRREPPHRGRARDGRHRGPPGARLDERLHAARRALRDDLGPLGQRSAARGLDAAFLAARDWHEARAKLGDLRAAVVPSSDAQRGTTLTGARGAVLAPGRT